YHEVAMDYFWHALHTDLGDLHHNTEDGIHVASTGGVWTALVFGFGGLRDHEGALSFDPRLPKEWESLQFKIAWQGSRLLVRLTQDALHLSLEGDGPVEVSVRGERVTVTPEGVEVALEHQGERIDGLMGDLPHTGGV